MILYFCRESNQHKLMGTGSGQMVNNGPKSLFSQSYQLRMDRRWAARYCGCQILWLSDTVGVRYCRYQILQLSDTTWVSDTVGVRYCGCLILQLSDSLDTVAGFRKEKNSWRNLTHLQWIPANYVSRICILGDILFLLKLSIFVSVCLSVTNFVLHISLKLLGVDSPIFIGMLIINNFWMIPLFHILLFRKYILI